MKTNLMTFIAAMGVVLAAPVAATTQFDERRAAEADGTVEVSNVAGSVRIVGWRRNEVRVEGTLGGGVERLEFDTRGDRTIVRVHLERGQRRTVDGSAQLVVHVPRGSRVIANTVSATLAGDALDGALELKTVSGDIELNGGYTQAEVQSVSGSVRILGSGKRARVDAGSISGQVVVDDMDGELTANSISGSVRVTARGLHRVSLKSVSGQVAYDGALADGGRYELETTSGTARLTARGRLNAAFELHTANGAIRNAFGPSPERTSRHAPGQTLQFTEGQGSAQVRMRAITGTLHLGSG